MERSMGWESMDGGKRVKGEKMGEGKENRR
jgi:hypothetical protein